MIPACDPIRTRVEFLTARDVSVTKSTDIIRKPESFRVVQDPKTKIG